MARRRTIARRELVERTDHQEYWSLTDSRGVRAEVVMTRGAEGEWVSTINGHRAPLRRTRIAHRALAVAEAFVCGMD